jgi:hypothetical protein
MPIGPNSAILAKLQSDLQDLLECCSTTDQINAHFSQYLLGEMQKNNIEDYEYYTEFTDSTITARVGVFLASNAGMNKYEILVVKMDNANDAYDRAMAVV